MAVQLKRDTSTVIESLRTARRADDATSRLRVHSFETHCVNVKHLVESMDWKYGPAELVATMPHHAVARTRDRKLVRVEWSVDADTGAYSLNNSKVFESATPAADIGAELFETARAAVGKILDEDSEGLERMIGSMAEALETAGGDLQRRLNTELSLRSIQRNAWWHQVVSEHFDGAMPPLPLAGPDVAGSMGTLLHSLKDAAASVSLALRQIDESAPDEGLVEIARDISQDIAHAMAAVMNVDRENESEMVNVYETVVSVSGHLLNGAGFLAQIADTTKKDRE